MTKLADRADTLLTDLAERNPAPEETVFARDWFDPMHGLTELRYAARRGLITIIESGSAPARFRFLITKKGRATAAALSEEGAQTGVSTTLTKVRALLDDLAFENPPAEERWIDASNFDPPHDAAEVRYAVRRAWIEVEGNLHEPVQLRMRLTENGRRRLEQQNATLPTAAQHARA